MAAVRVVRVGHCGDKRRARERPPVTPVVPVGLGGDTLTQRVGDEVEEGVPQQPPRREAEQQPQQRLVPRGVGLQRDEEEEEVRRRADHQGGAQRLGRGQRGLGGVTLVDNPHPGPGVEGALTCSHSVSVSGRSGAGRCRVSGGFWWPWGTWWWSSWA